MIILWIKQSLLAFKQNIFRKTKPTQLKIADHKTKEKNYLCSQIWKKQVSQFDKNLDLGIQAFVETVLIDA